MTKGKCSSGAPGLVQAEVMDFIEAEALKPELYFAVAEAGIRDKQATQISILEAKVDLLLSTVDMRSSQNIPVFLATCFGIAVGILSFTVLAKRFANH